MALAGTVLGGRYELDEQVGNGGYCEVWRATDTVLSRLVAVKLLHPGYASKPDALARFQAEARHTGALSHDNIARVLDYGEPTDRQPPYLVMELVDGPSLEDVLADGPLDARRSMDVIAQAAAGLQAAHAAGLVHRDVKPANILLASGGIVKLTDFGIAHAVGSAAVTPSGEMVGTPGYLSPEQVAGEQATAVSDLYTLGVVAYECLAGAPPFDGMALEIAVAHRDRPLPPLPPSVPADVATFVMYLTAKDPAWRPGSAAEVALSAGRLRDGLSATMGAGTGGGPHRAPEAPAEASVTGPDQRPRAGRHRPALALAALVLAGLTALVVATMTGFASGWHQASVRPSTPSGQSRATVAPVRTADSPSSSPRGRPPSASPAASPAAQPSSGQAAAITSGKLGHKRGQGHGNGQGNGNGNGKAQTDSTSG
jgi:eukaryotic-like serine/threonine-protein kinase